MLYAWNGMPPFSHLPELDVTGYVPDPSSFHNLPPIQHRPQNLQQSKRMPLLHLKRMTPTAKRKRVAEAHPGVKVRVSLLRPVMTR